MLDQLLRLPRHILASIIMLAAIVFIIYYQPPHTPCTAQIEYFKDIQKRFLFSDKNKEISSQFDRLRKICIETNSYGSCSELFVELHKFVQDLIDIPLTCNDEVSSLSEVEEVLFKSIRLMAELAWGPKPPETTSDKMGWLESSDVRVFCLMTERAKLLYGQEAWSKFQESVMNSYKLSENLTRQVKWERSIFSLNCNYYR